MMKSVGNIVFRLDADNMTGFGHIQRCYLLAIEMQKLGYKCYLKCNKPNVAQIFCSECFDSIDGTTSDSGNIEDAKDLLNYCDLLSADYIVVDLHHTCMDFEYKIRDSRFKWLEFISNPDKKFSSNIIYSANPSLLGRDFCKLTNNIETLTIVGPEYAIMRPGFSFNDKKIICDKVKNIILILGGGWDRGAFRKLLPIINQLVNSAQINIICSSSNPSLNFVKKFTQLNNHKFNLYVEPKNLPELFKLADVAITAGGTTTLECAASQLPMCLISIAANQIKQCKAWRQLECGYYLGGIEDITKERMANVLKPLESPAVRSKFSQNLRELHVDGNGANKIANAINNQIQYVEQSYL